MLRFGSVLSLTVADAKAADTFIANAKFILPATSFGGVHTSAERRARWGDQVPEGFIRLSIGIEPTEILWKDIASSLAIL
jgi:cystathionine gamma-lyase